MTSAFLFLTLRSFRNRLVSGIRRLKRPRYLLFALLGIGYFYLVAGRHWIKGVSIASRAGLPPIPPVLPEVAGALLILGSLVVAWCAPTPPAPMAFTEAEIQHLFTAPVTRRALIRWKLLRGQVGVLFGVAMVTLMLGGRLAPGGRAIFFAGAWAAFTTMQLHSAGARMALHSLARAGVTWGTRLLVVAPAAAAALAAAGLWSWRRVGPPPPGLREGGEALAGFGAYVETLAGAWPAWLLLLPGRTLVRPAIAPDPARFLLALAPAGALLLAHYLWVIRSGAALEEGAAEAARRLAEARGGAARGGRRARGRILGTPPPFRLSPLGRPETALVWKNLIAAFRNVGGLRALILFGGGSFAVIVASLRLSRGDAAQAAAGTICAMIAGMIVLAGPSMLRIDFRLELAHVDTLRSYPLSGRSLLLGTLLAPMILLTVMEWALLGGSAILMGGAAGAGKGLAPLIPWLALAAAIVAPPLIAMATLLHNAGFILAPAWVATGPRHGMGIERIGQSLFSTFALVLVMAVSIIPAALIFGVAWVLISAFLGGGVSLPLSALPAAVVLAGEWWLGILLLGARLDRLDPSEELDSVVATG